MYTPDTGDYPHFPGPATSEDTVLKWRSDYIVSMAHPSIPPRHIELRRRGTYTRSVTTPRHPRSQIKLLKAANVSQRTIDVLNEQVGSAFGPALPSRRLHAARSRALGLG